jgi:hypothetical protein
MANLAPAEMQKRLMKALKVAGNTSSPEDIAKAVAEGRMQSWTRNDSLVITEVREHPRKTVLNIVLAVGVLEDVLALQPEFMAFGREHGCQAVRMQGRRGWDAILPDEGWKKVPQVIYERAL